MAANSNIAIYSTDGINWTQTTLPVSANWVSVCYGNDKFVAVAHARKFAAYSTDGINWSEITMLVPGTWESICYGGGKFVAVINGSQYVVCLKDSFDEWA